jgi:electron transfer flavoprotein beta subunit
MEVVALAKYVPNPAGTPPEIGPDFGLRRGEAGGGLDPADEPALELAVRLGDDVRIVSIGPERALEAVWRALALGAHRATLVTDELLCGADALATARVLAAAIARQSFDIVIAGVESTDGATGTVPMTLAELLDVPCATFATEVSVADGVVRARRQTGHGDDVLECELPAVVTVTAGAAVARHPSLRDAIAAKKKPVERLSLADLGIDADAVEPTQRVTAVAIAPEKQAGELLEDGEEGARRLVALLEEIGAV